MSIYPVDAYTGGSCKSSSIHRVTSNGTVSNNIGATNGRNTKRIINIGRDALETWGGKKWYYEKIINIYCISAIVSEISCRASDSIKYVLSDSVEITIEKYISNYICDHNYGVNFCFILSHISDNFKISIVPIKSKSEYKNLWFSNTNRFILIKENYYPLIFDFDMLFGAIGKSLGNYGSRNDNIRRLYISGDFYSIVFTKKGTLLTGQQCSCWRSPWISF